MINQVLTSTCSDGFHQERSRKLLIRQRITGTLSFLNKKKQRNNTPLDEVSTELSETLIESSYFNGDKIQLKLQKAILTLPDKQRLIFNMKYYDDLKYEEISEITGTSVGALKASFHIAVKKVEAFMLNDDITF